MAIKYIKVHKILEFKQSPWIKSQIDFNTQKRIQATNASDQNFFKLMINSVYPKTMENMRKRMKIRYALLLIIKIVLNIHLNQHLKTLLSLVKT